MLPELVRGLDPLAEKLRIGRGSGAVGDGLRHGPLLLALDRET
jgi:hypothetical protein